MTMTMPRAGLTGPSKTYIVEPQESPTIPERMPEAPPERAPEPAREPVREPEKVPA
jgi:hypothetical protein